MKRSIFYLICVICTMAVIFMFSAENVKKTMRTSDIIVKPIENRIKEKSTKSFKDDKAEAKYWKNVENKLDKIVRKCAHGIFFGLLGIFSVLFFKSIGMDCGDAIMAAMLLCVAYAGCDELHQKFIDGRNARMEDVCIDTFGAWAGNTIVYVYNKFFMKNRRL